MTAPIFPKIGARGNDAPIASPTGLQPPVMNFTYTVAGLTVTFTDASADPDGTIVFRQWGFGDAVLRPTPSFTYTKGGLFVLFMDLSTDVAPGFVTQWAWNFGDGTTSVEQHPAHAYVAGGTYTVSLTVTDNDGNGSLQAFTQSVSVVAGGLGTPVGIFGGFSVTGYQTFSALFPMSVNATQPTNVINQLRLAFALGHKLVLQPASGSHSLYMTNGSFDLSKWKSRLDLFNTAAIKAEIEIHRANGTIVGINVMDEPQSTTWGPAGNITRAMIDGPTGMVAYVKSIVGSLMPVGIHMTSDYLQGSSYGPLVRTDFVNTQFVQAWEKSGKQIAAGYPGTVQGWRDWALDNMARDGVVPILSMNISNGGWKSSAVTACNAPTGGYSPTSPQSSPTPRCQMGTTAFAGDATFNAVAEGQIKTYGKALLDPHSTDSTLRAAGLTMWEYTDEVLGKSNVRSSVQDVITYGNALPQRSWHR